jgi:hypothetical protein
MTPEEIRRDEAEQAAIYARRRRIEMDCKPARVVSVAVHTYLGPKIETFIGREEHVTQKLASLFIVKDGMFNAKVWLTHKERQKVVVDFDRFSVFDQSVVDKINKAIQDARDERAESKRLR